MPICEQWMSNYNLWFPKDGYPLPIVIGGYPHPPLIIPAMPATPIASNYSLNEQWAPLAVYGKRAPFRRKLRGQHKHAKRNAMKANSRKCQTAHAWPLLEPAGFSQLVLVLDLSVATVLRSYSYQRPLAEKAASWIANPALAKNFLCEFRNNRWLAHTGVGPTSSKQALTAHQLYAVMHRIYPLTCSPRCSVLCFPSHFAHRTLGHAPL